MKLAALQSKLRIWRAAPLHINMRNFPIIGTNGNLVNGNWQISPVTRVKLGCVLLTTLHCTLAHTTAEAVVLFVICVD